MSADKCQSWHDLVEEERKFFGARARFMQEQKRDKVLRAALSDPIERGTALRILLQLPPSVSQTMADVLVDQASVGHSDIQLIRDVLARIDRAWLLSHIERLSETPLREGDYEDYRRIAELYVHLQAQDALQRLLERCRCHASEDVREIADDFADRVRSDRS
jgi:hypothetical protein